MPIDVRANIANNVRAEMARHSKTQRDLAALLSIDQQSISLRCRGERSFRAEELVAIAEWLDVPLGQLTGSSVAA